VWESRSEGGGGGGGGSIIGEEDIPHRTFKVILAGDAAVGKTTFIERVCQGHFAPNLSSTIGEFLSLSNNGNNKALDVLNISLCLSLSL